MLRHLGVDAWIRVLENNVLERAAVLGLTVSAIVATTHHQRIVIPLFSQTNFM